MARQRNIKRVDNETTRTHGWVVTVQRRGEIVVRLFADGVYGGKKKALAAAAAYRDLLLSHHSQFEHQVWARSRLRKNNTSGIPGVGRYEVLANANTGRRDKFWLAFWVDELGRSRKRKFAISRYGEHHAKRLAIAERERQLLRVCAIKNGADEVRSFTRGSRPKGALAGSPRATSSAGRSS
jgi:hypothetical protein